VVLLKGKSPDFPGPYSTISSQQSRGFIRISPGEIIQAGVGEFATIPRRYFQFIELTYNIPGMQRNRVEKKKRESKQNKRAQEEKYGTEREQGG
jgi:hypothetical protein